MTVLGILSRTPWKPAADPLWSTDPCSLKTAAVTDMQLPKLPGTDMLLSAPSASSLLPSTKRKFHVAVPPRIDTSLVSRSNLSVIVDRSIAIDCPVTGIPLPDIVWFKDGQQLATNQNDDIRVVSRGQRLEVNNADLGDAGEYKCLAKNAAGFVERDFHLHVWG